MGESLDGQIHRKNTMPRPPPAPRWLEVPLSLLFTRA